MMGTKVLRLVQMILVLGIISIFGIANTLEAATLKVCPDSLCETGFSSIQDAINVASHGDVVLVHDGTYLERIDFLGKAITVKSVNGAASTIIDGGARGNVVTAESGEGRNSILDGFTVTNGRVYSADLSASESPTRAQLNGGGIYCSSSSPTIIACNIIHNHASKGGGVYFSGGLPVMIDCIISNNTANDGGGIFAHKSSLTLTNSIVSNNSTIGSGGGVYCFSSASATVVNCTFNDNVADYYGGGVFCDKFSLVAVMNSILWEDTSGLGSSEIYVGADSAVKAIYSNVWGGYPGVGNIDADPLFVGHNDYHLSSDSPCADAGIVTGTLARDIDGDSRPQGVGYDMGADETGSYGSDSKGLLTSIQ